MSSRAKKKIRRPLPPPDQDALDTRRMVRHGITPEDLAAADRRGYDRGTKAGREYVLKDTYAAAAMAYMDVCKERGIPCDREQVRALLIRMDDYICNALTSEEIIDDAWRKVGLYLEFTGAFPEDRVVENEP